VWRPWLEPKRVGPPRARGGASLLSDSFMLSILAYSFSSSSFMPSLLPMDTEWGSTDTKLSRTEEAGRLEGGIWRRLYSKEVAGRGPGPRRHGGAAGSPRRARGCRSREAKVQSSKPDP
jgi:hypothetical protein